MEESFFKSLGFKKEIMKRFHSKQNYIQEFNKEQVKEGFKSRIFYKLKKFDESYNNHLHPDFVKILNNESILDQSYKSFQNQNDISQFAQYQPGKFHYKKLRYQDISKPYFNFIKQKNIPKYIKLPELYSKFDMFDEKQKQSYQFIDEVPHYFQDYSGDQRSLNDAQSWCKSLKASISTKVLEQQNNKNDKSILQMKNEIQNNLNEIQQQIKKLFQDIDTNQQQFPQNNLLKRSININKEIQNMTSILKQSIFQQEQQKNQLDSGLEEKRKQMSNFRDAILELSKQMQKIDKKQQILKENSPIKVHVSRQSTKNLRFSKSISVNDQLEQQQELNNKKNEIINQQAQLKNQIQEYLKDIEKMDKNQVLLAYEIKLLNKINIDFLYQILKMGKDVKNNGLSNTIAELWRCKHEVEVKHLPDFLDDKTKEIIIQITHDQKQIEQIENSNHQIRQSYLQKISPDKSDLLSESFNRKVSHPQETIHKQLSVPKLQLHSDQSKLKFSDFEPTKTTMNQIQYQEGLVRLFKFEQKQYDKLLSSRSFGSKKQSNDNSSHHQIQDRDTVLEINQTYQQKKQKMELKLKQQCDFECQRILKEFELKNYAQHFNIDLETYLATIVGDVQALNIVCRS